MPRRILPFSSVLCLFLCGAILALWLRGYRQIDYVLWKTPANWNSIGSAYGRIVFKSVRGFPAGASGVKTTQAVQPTWAKYVDPQLSPNFLGFAWVKSDSLGQYQGHNVYFRVATVPDWFLLALFLAMPLMSAVKRSRRNKMPPEGP